MIKYTKLGVESKYSWKVLLLAADYSPLILTKEEKIICLDAKVNFDSNALFRHPEIVELRDLNEEDPTEIESQLRHAQL